MNRLPLAKRAQILGLLIEGNSVRATSRLAEVSFNSVLKFVSDMGRACDDYQDRTLRNLTCKRVQVDEIWAFCYAKKTNLKKATAAPEGAGDVWAVTQFEFYFRRPSFATSPGPISGRLKGQTARQSAQLIASLK